MSPAEMKAKIVELLNKKKEIEKELNTVSKAYVESKTNVKVGDVVTYSGAKYKWEVTRIIQGGMYEDPVPRFCGCKIKKDGNPGMIENVIYPGKYKLEVVKNEP